MTETTKTKKLKVYICNNFDGRRQAMVAAPTLEIAAKTMRTTASHMRTYGWHFAKDEDADLALERPGVVFFASITAPKADWVSATAPLDLSTAVEG